MQKSLLIGCGNSRAKKVMYAGQTEWTGQLVTLDMNPHCNPDVLWDLETLPLPFEDGEFDELAAYDVLEHQGRQGDWRRWFDEFREYHRILKSGGSFGIIVPIGADALADPGHTRFITKNYFGFLTEKFYVDNLARGAQVTDYRWYKDYAFDIAHLEQQGEHHLAVVLVKP